jgi:hypothetical protein
MSYTKLFGSILLSTVWELDSEARIVWITMLALCDRDGIVSASVPGLARQAAVSREATERALAAFLAPDPDSRTPEHEGRRIVPVDGGWRLLNHAKYRDMDTAERRREADAKRQAEKRERDRLRNSATLPPTPPAPEPKPSSVTGRDMGVTGCDKSHGIPKVTPSDADADADADASQMQIKSDPDPEGERAGAPPPSRVEVVDRDTKPGKRGTRIHALWTPSPATTAALAADGFSTADMTRTLQTFVDYWLGVPGHRGCKLDWDATFRVWIRKDRDQRRDRAGPRGNPRAALVQRNDPNAPWMPKDF